MGCRLSFWLTWDRATWFWPAAYHFITAPCFILHGFQVNLQDLLQGASVLLQRQMGAWLSSQREGGVVPLEKTCVASVRGSSSSV